LDPLLYPLPVEVLQLVLVGLADPAFLAYHYCPEVGTSSVYLINAPDYPA
jgi:hypothetical protein